MDIKLNEDENIGKLWYMDVYHSFPFLTKAKCVS